MVIAFCLNPSFDKTVTVEKLTPGALNRVLSVREDAGGKGVNVAVGLKRLGAAHRLLVCTGTANGERFGGLLKSEGVASRSFPVEGAVRTNLKVISRADGTVTEINEPGAPVPETVAGALADAAVEALGEEPAGRRWAVLTGSLPPGAPADTYARLIRALRARDVRCLLDADGEALRLGLAAEPAVVKPNLSELEGLCGRRLDGLHAIAAAAREKLLTEGTEFAAVTLGAQGALLIRREGVWFAPPLPVQAASPIGAGDAMAAGLTAALDAGDSVEAAFLNGVVCATAAVGSEGTQGFDPSGAAFASARAQARMERVL